MPKRWALLVQKRRFRSRTLLPSLGTRTNRLGRDAMHEVAKPPGRGAPPAIDVRNRTNRKKLYKTKTCGESWITVACYLCNTLPKTACSTPFPAVPLLRVQEASVIVI